MGPPTAPLDPLVWKACAGAGAHVPTAGSTVYYFPQGHAEQASAAPDLSSIPDRKPFHRCRITSVSFLANTETDEVYAKIYLDPRTPSEPLQTAGAALDPADVMFFPKVLTPSDANNGGGFSVPRQGAESMFPLLDYGADLPFQNICIRDVHGTVWGFRHIFRGTPRRHLLTTGWSRFVNSKKLVAGDSVVFIKDRAGGLLIGIRRVKRTFGRGSAQAAEGVVAVAKEGFSRNGKGMVPPESVVEAVKRAEMGLPFEVIYYPRSQSPNFVVDAEIVEASRRVQWNVGLPVKMSVESEDASTMTSLQGTVSGTVVNDPAFWPSSPWRMFRVTLDEKFLRNTRNVNPWQVELVTNAFCLHASYPSLKRLRVGPSSEQPTNIVPDLYHPGIGFIGDRTPPLPNYSSFPAGMQGARRNSCDTNLTNSVHKNTNYLSDSSNSNKLEEKSNVVSTKLSIGHVNLVHKNTSYLSDSSNSNKLEEKSNDVSTKLSIGHVSRSDSSSPRSQSENTKFLETDSNSVVEKRSFLKLFGTAIQVDEAKMETTIDFPCILSRGSGVGG